MPLAVFFCSLNSVDISAAPLRFKKSGIDFALLLRCGNSVLYPKARDWKAG